MTGDETGWHHLIYKIKQAGIQRGKTQLHRKPRASPAKVDICILGSRMSPPGLIQTVRHNNQCERLLRYAVRIMCWGPR